jgi:hypothetical protein
MGLNECARAAEETEKETPYARELRRRRIKANRQNREYLLAELGRPNLSAVVKTLVEHYKWTLPHWHKRASGTCRARGDCTEIDPALAFTPSLPLATSHGPAYDKR